MVEKRKNRTMLSLEYLGLGGNLQRFEEPNIHHSFDGQTIRQRLVLLLKGSLLLKAYPKVGYAYGGR